LSRERSNRVSFEFGRPLIDTQFAFGDRLMVSDEELLRRLKVKRTPKEEAAADAKAL